MNVATFVADEAKPEAIDAKAAAGMVRMAVTLFLGKSDPEHYGIRGLLSSVAPNGPTETTEAAKLVTKLVTIPKDASEEMKEKLESFGDIFATILRLGRANVVAIDAAAVELAKNTESRWRSITYRNRMQNYILSEKNPTTGALYTFEQAKAKAATDAKPRDLDDEATTYFAGVADKAPGHLANKAGLSKAQKQEAADAIAVLAKLGL